MVVLAFLTDPSVVNKILRHLRLPTRPPPLAPARPLDDSDDNQDPTLFNEMDWDADAERDPQNLGQDGASARAPPGTRGF